MPLLIIILRMYRSHASSVFFPQARYVENVLFSISGQGLLDWPILGIYSVMQNVRVAGFYLLGTLVMQGGAKLPRNARIIATL